MGYIKVCWPQCYSVNMVQVHNTRCKYRMVTILELRLGILMLNTQSALQTSVQLRFNKDCLVSSMWPGGNQRLMTFTQVFD